ARIASLVPGEAYGREGLPSEDTKTRSYRSCVPARGRHGPGEGLRPQGVEYLATPDPAAAGHVDAKLEIPVVADGVCIGGDHEADASLTRQPDPPGGHVQPARVAVDLDRGSGGRDDVQHLLHAALDGRTREDEPPEGVAPDLEGGMRHGPCEAPSHLGGVEAKALVHAGDDDVQLLEDTVGVVEGPVGQDVDLAPSQELDRYRFLDAGNLLPLGLEVVDAQASRIGGGGRVVRDRQILHAEGLGGPGHLLDGMTAVRVDGMAMHHSLDVVPTDQIPWQAAIESRLDL